LFEFVDRGGRQGNRAQTLNQWRHPVASSEALDVLHRAMRPALYRRIRKKIEITRDLPAFFCLLFVVVVAHYHSEIT
jgi:hypothetical protein